MSNVVQIGKVHRGFTIVEVASLIVIIASVAAILFPVFAHVREKAHQDTCLSNTRQIGIAVSVYLQDYDRGLPRHTTADPLGVWKESLLPYVKNRDVFHCPSDPSPIDHGGRRSSYITNAWLIGSRGYGTDIVVPTPASVIYVAESVDQSLEDQFHPMCWGETDPEVPGSARAPFAWDAEKGETREIALRRHNDGANYIYLDGHAKWRQWSQVYWQDRRSGIYEGDFDPRQ